ncbi:MAG: BMP family protein [Clostridia bacterium]
MKKLVAVLLTVLMLASALVGCSTPAAETPAATTTTEAAVTPVEPEKKFSVALLLPGPVNDGGFNQAAYEGYAATKEKYNIETSYTENIPLVDYETVILDYVDKGVDLIIGFSADFTDAMVKIAPTALDTQFVVISGKTAQEPNLAVYRFNTPETGFIAGSLAALVSKDGTVGIIAGQSFPHVKDAVVGFEAGAKYINPSIKVLTGYTESWTDMAKGKEMAMAMLDQGADVLSGNANAVTLGIIGAAAERGKRAIGYVSDQNSIAPEAIAASAIQDGGMMMDTIVKDGLAGNIKPVVVLVGAKDGAIRMSKWYHEDWVGAEGVKKMDDIINGLKDGSLKEKGIVPKSSFEN